MSNTNYLLQNTSFSSETNITNTNIPQNEVKKITPEYTIIKGFSYAKNNNDLFTISLSPQIIDYGELSATNPVIRTSILSIEPGSAYSFSVYSYENHQLSAKNNQISIPDTSCDNGDCNGKASDSWTNILTYGFGYRCDDIIGRECSSSFNNPDQYKQFIDSSKNSVFQLLLQNEIPQSNSKSQITYKVNISKTQEKGIYTNMVTYIAVPSF